MAAFAAVVALAIFMLHRRASSAGSHLASALPAGTGAPEFTHIPCDGDDDAIAAWIWRHLVPRSGQALTVQGELLRAVEKLRSEAQGNGNINWNEHFEKLIDFLHAHLVAREALPVDMTLSLLADLARLRDFLPVDQLEDASQAEMLPYVDDDLYDRLTAGVVAFCRVHTRLIPRAEDPDLRC